MYMCIHAHVCCSSSPSTYRMPCTCAYTHMCAAAPRRPHVVCTMYISRLVKTCQGHAHVHAHAHAHARSTCARTCYTLCVSSNSSRMTRGLPGAGRSGASPAHHASAPLSSPAPSEARAGRAWKNKNQCKKQKGFLF